MRPNILLFFTDDQRFDTIRALGNTEIATPNIDALVARGTSFTQAHIPCGTSGAVCMPSRAMLHTGRTLFHIQGQGQQIPDDHSTLGETLRAAGYDSFGTGKWHNGTAAYHRSFSHGDEIFFGGMCDHWNVPAHRFDPTGAYEAQFPRCVDPMRSAETTMISGDHITPGKHSSELVCDAAIDFIHGLDGEDPFFSYVSFLAPHDPRTMPEEFRRMYDPAQIELPPNFCGGHPFDTGALHIRDEMLASHPRTPEETRAHLADYYGMISHLDHQLGRVMTALEASGRLESTIVVFAGDNGLALGQHGLFGKQSCYEHSVRVPLIMAGPGIPAGKQTDAFAYLLDIFPTLCDLIGIDIPSSVEGQSLLPAIQGDDQGRESLYFAYVDLQRAVKTQRHKLIEYAVPDRERVTQLFDLQADPWEMHNLASDTDQAATVAQMRSELQRHRATWEDQGSRLTRHFWERYETVPDKGGM